MEPAEVRAAHLGLLWAARKSQRYHSRRCAYFDRWSKATAWVSIIGASSAIASIGDVLSPLVGVLAALAAAGLSAADLIVDHSEMARRHDELRRRFSELERTVSKDPAPGPEKLVRWRDLRLAIEADEPPSYVALDLLCENELRRTQAHLGEPHLVRIPTFKRLTAQILRWYGS